jgi:hypothetical protein
MEHLKYADAVVGMQVVCIDGGEGLVEGRVYTISEISPGRPEYCDTVRVAEVSDGDAWYSPSRFVSTTEMLTEALMKMLSVFEYEGATEGEMLACHNARAAIAKVKSHGE